MNTIEEPKVPSGEVKEQEFEPLPYIDDPYWED